MTNIFGPSVRLYGLLMLLYPGELRRDFGSEMLEVFAEDLRHAIDYRGAKGAAGVWWRTLRELTRIALPAHAGNRIIAVPFILFCINELLLLLELFIAWGMKFTPFHFSIAVLGPGVLAALTSIVVVIVGKTNPFCLLSLGPGSCSKFTI